MPMLSVALGSTAAAPTATAAAISAYSIKSWPWLSFKIFTISNASLSASSLCLFLLVVDYGYRFSR